MFFINIVWWGRKRVKIILGNGLILYCSAAGSTSLLLLLVLAATARSVIYCFAVLQVIVINVSKHTKRRYITIQYRSISMMFWRGLVVFRFTQYNGICAWWAFHLLKFVIILYDGICAWWAFYLLMI